MNKPEYILDELTKGIKMGMDSISTISEEVTNTDLKQDLIYQFSEYNSLLNSIDNELKKYDKLPKELNPMQKAMGWMTIKWNTMDNRTDSKIAEMMVQGLNMGITEGVKLSNNNPNAEGNINSILDNFVAFQENSIKQLQKYL